MLNWIKNNKPLSVFVKKHVDEFRSEPDVVLRCISTNDNSADIPTRVESVTDLKSNIL